MVMTVTNLSFDLPADAYARAAGYAAMDEEEMAFVAGVFSALGNPTRLHIAQILAGGERTVGEVAREALIAQPNASLSLAMLQRAGIARAVRKGAQRVYSLRGPRIVALLILARQFRSLHAGAIASESVDGVAEPPVATVIPQE